MARGTAAGAGIAWAAGGRVGSGQGHDERGQERNGHTAGTRSSMQGRGHGPGTRAGGIEEGCRVNGRAGCEAGGAACVRKIRTRGARAVRCVHFGLLVLSDRGGVTRIEVWSVAQPQARGGTGRA